MSANVRDAPSADPNHAHAPLTTPAIARAAAIASTIEMNASAVPRRITSSDPFWSGDRNPRLATPSRPPNATTAPNPKTIRSPKPGAPRASSAAPKLAVMVTEYPKAVALPPKDWPNPQINRSRRPRGGTPLPVRDARSSSMASRFDTAGPSPSRCTPVPIATRAAARRLRRCAHIDRRVVSGDDAAKESNLPSRGLPGPASFEDWMGHQARAAPPVIVRGRGSLMIARDRSDRARPRAPARRRP